MWVLIRFLEYASNVFVLTPQILSRMGQIPNPIFKEKEIINNFLESEVKFYEKSQYKN